MFRSLKDKLGESLAGTPARNLLPTGQKKEVGRSGTSKTSTPSGSFLDSPNQSHALTENDLSPLSVSRSRTSSISSQASDLSFASPASVPIPGSLDLDGSFSEVETDSATVTTLNKDELYQMYCKAQRHSRQYKTGYLQVMTAYKEMEKERDKLKNTLAQTQDKAFRQISDLKTNLKTKSGESEELVKVLQLQINLLKDGKPIPDELTSKAEQLLNASTTQSLPSDLSSVKVDTNSNISLDANALREKVKRLESLLTKCQETMKNNKEKMQQLMSEREDMCQKLDIKSEELDKLKDENKEVVLKFQNQLKDARKLIEDLESDKAMSMATMKQEFHETLETKDSELVEQKGKIQGLDAENSNLKEEIQNLKKAGEERLEKSREIIRKLKMEKNQLEAETKQKIEKSEHTLEMEKDTELQELRRGKVEALQVLQQQMQDKIKELEEEKETALEERDKQWAEKLLQKEQEKLKEFDVVLAEKQEEMTLAIEEQQLQRMAAVKQCDLVAADLRSECERLAQAQKEMGLKYESILGETSSQIRSLEEQIVKVRQETDLRLQETESKHDLELALMREKCEAEYNKKVEDIKVEYTLKISEISSKFEQKLAESQAEADVSYETMLSNMKLRNEVAVDGSQSIIVHLQNEAKESTDRRVELEARVSELESQLSAEKELTEHYLKESQELDSRAKTDRESFQSRLKGLIERIDRQSNSMDVLVEENQHLHAELASIQSKSDERIASMRKEVENLCQSTAEKFLSASEAKTGSENLDASPVKLENVDGNSSDHGNGNIHPLEEATVTLTLDDLGVDQLRTEIQRLQAETVSKDLHTRQIASATDTIKTLKQRISDLMDRENQLNVELEQSKTENERNLASHNSEMLSLRSKMEELRSSEKALKEQVHATNERCEAELARASMENVSAISNFSELLAESQKEMGNILQDLMETKECSNEMVTNLEQELQQKCLELEDAYRLIQELSGNPVSVTSWTDIVTNHSVSQAVLTDDTKDSEEGKQVLVMEAVNPTEGNMTSNDLPGSQMNTAVLPGNQMNTALLQEVANNTENRDAGDGTSSHGHQGNDLILADSFSPAEMTSEELFQRIAELEYFLAEKDARILWFESKVKDFGKEIQHETEEMRMRSRQVELLMADKDELLKEKDELTKNQSLLIKDLEAKILELNSVVFTKTSDFSELQSKFWQLQSEAKSRISSLKKRLLERDGGEDSDASEGARQTREDVAAEMTEVRQRHEAEIKLLKERLQIEQQNVEVFKENVRKQFEENQEKAKFVIDKIKDNCEQSLIDRDHLYEIKLMNLEREKNAEKEKEVKELTLTIQKLREEQQTPHGSEAVEKQAEEINFVRAELESLKVRHHEAVLRFQSEKEALLKQAGEGSEQLWEKLKQLEQRSEEGGGQVAGTADVNQVKLALEAELEKLLVENCTLRQRVSDLEKQRDAVLKMAKEVKIDQEGSTVLGTGAEEALEKLEERVKFMEQKEELERLQSEVSMLVEKIALQEQQQKETNEQHKMEEKETDIRHSEEVTTLREHNKLKDDTIKELNEKISHMVELEGRSAKEEFEELKTLNNLKEDMIKGLNEKVCRLEGLERESANRLEEVTKLSELNQLKEDAINELNWKISELEANAREDERKLQERENAFLTQINSLKAEPAAQIEEVTKLQSSSRVDSEVMYQKEHDELNARVQKLQDELNEKQKDFEAEKNRIEEESRERSTRSDENLAELEKVNLDLEARLKELSEKLSCVTENSIHLEKVVEEYRSLEEEHRLTADACRKQRSIEQELEVLRLDSDKKNQSILECGEALALAEAKLKKSEEKMFIMKSEHHMELERTCSEWQAKLEAVKTEQENFLKSSDGAKEALEGRSGFNSYDDHVAMETVPFGGSGDRSLTGHPLCSNRLSIERVERKIHKVVLPVVEFLPDEECLSADGTGEKSFQKWHEWEVERLRSEHRAAVQLLEDEHNSKVLQLIKDFNGQMVEREQQITETFQEEIETLLKTEARLLADHREQIHELNQQINDRNQRVEEIVQNCDAQIQTADERHRDYVEKLNQIIQDLQQTLLDKEHEWMMSRESARSKEEMQQLSSSHAVHGSAATLEQLPASQISSVDRDRLKDRVVQLESDLEELRLRHRVEVGELTSRLERYEAAPLSPLLPGLDHKDSLVALGGDDVFRLLEMQNSHLQTEVSRYLTENARLKEREKELLHKLETLAVSTHGLHLGATSTTAILGSLLMEPTEMEYLKNILYKYMIGLETKTLAKVICTVVKFSEDQTRLIMEKEETRSSIFSSVHR